MNAERSSALLDETASATALPGGGFPFSPAPDPERAHRLLLFLVLALAAALRLYHLGQESLWFDEGWVVRVTNLSNADLVADAAADVHPPLYYFFMKFWVCLFGAGEWVLRFPSVLFGLVTVYGVYRLGRALYEPATGLAGAFLTALSVFHVRYSQEARSYALIAMLVVFSTLAFWRLIMTPSGRLLKAPGGRVALGYLAATAPLLYVHNFALMALAAQWAFVVGLALFDPAWRRPRRLAPFFALQAFLGLLYLPWVGVLLRQVGMIRKGFWIPPMTLKTLLDALTEYAGSWRLIGLFVPLALLAAVRYGRARREGEVSWLDRPALPACAFLALMILIPNLVPYAVSRLMAPMYTTKSTIFCAPMLYLLAAHAIIKFRPRLLQFIALAVLGVLCFANVRAEDLRVRKEPWRDAVSELERAAEPGDLVLFNWGDCLANAYFYYSHRPDLVKYPFPKGGWLITEQSFPELDALLKGRDRLWVILCRAKDPRDLLLGRLRAQYNERFRKLYKGYDEYIEIFRFER